MIYETSDIRNGLRVLVDGDPFFVTYFQFVKPGKGTAFTRTKLKNMLNGRVIERTFRTGEQLESADIEEYPAQYQYDDEEAYNFMNLSTFEQFAIKKEALTDTGKFLTDGLECKVLMFNGAPVNVELPNFIESEIVYCEPGVKGNTATGSTKLAELACGASVHVPLFVNQGDRIRVDTRTGDYVTRV